MRKTIQPYVARFRVSSFDVDTNNQLTATALTRFLLESAWRHAALLGYGYSALGERRLFWVLSRIAVEISDLPYWEEEVEVETWPGGTQRMFALREYAVHTTDGRPVAAGTSAWIVLDADKRRPVRVESLFDRDALETGRRALNRSLEKLPALTLPESAVAAPVPAAAADTASRSPQPDYRKQVVYSDLDRHDHVNSVTYIQWIIDSYPWGSLGGAQLEYFELNYLAETVGGEDVELFSAPEASADQDARWDTAASETGSPQACGAPQPAGPLEPSGIRLHLVRRCSDLRPICTGRLVWA